MCRDFWEKSPPKLSPNLTFATSKAHILKMQSFTDKWPSSWDRVFKNTALQKNLDRGSPCAGTFEKSPPKLSPNLTFATSKPHILKMESSTDKWPSSWGPRSTSGKREAWTVGLKPNTTRSINRQLAGRLRAWRADQGMSLVKYQLAIYLKWFITPRFDF